MHSRVSTLCIERAVLSYSVDVTSVFFTWIIKIYQVSLWIGEAIYGARSCCLHGGVTQQKNNIKKKLTPFGIDSALERRGRSDESLFFLTPWNNLKSFIKGSLEEYFCLVNRILAWGREDLGK